MRITDVSFCYMTICVKNIRVQFLHCLTLISMSIRSVMSLCEEAKTGVKVDSELGEFEVKV